MSPRQLRPTASPGLHRQARRHIPPAGDLPASQPLLAHAMERTGALPRPVHRARRLLLLVDTPARHMTGCLPYGPNGPADPTRRALLDELFARDGQTLVSLTARHDMTRIAVAKHLKILEDAGLVVSRRRGREKLHYLNPVPIRLIHDRWVSKYTEPW